MLFLNIDFSGSIKVAAENVYFQYCGQDEKMPNYISGVMYHLLTDEAKSQYIVEDIKIAMQSAVDESWERIDVSVDKE